MTFNDQDVQPNAVIPLDQVRVGATSDARWRACGPLTRVDRLVALTLEQAFRALRIKWERAS